MMELELGPKLKQLQNFLTDTNSEESKNYISDLLSGETARPEELFVQKYLNVDFWKEMGYDDSELKFERPAGISGRVEWTLKVEGKMIAIECKRPYYVKKSKEVKHQLDGSDIDELKDQIGPYLLSHPFIVFTNGFHWYFYSRESYRAWLINKGKKGTELKPYFKYLTADEIFDSKSPNFITNIFNRQRILETLSNFENKSIRHVLTDEFFVDLKTWVSYIDSSLKNAPANVKARTISLINKLIFVRTMEGVGIIPNGFLSTSWDNKKGIRKSTVSFIDNIDEELSEIYDTELFTPKYVEDKHGNPVEENGVPKPSPARAKNYAFKNIPEDFFSAILKQTEEVNLKDTGITKLNLLGQEYYIRSLYWWKFENISGDILGKAYETYLARQRKKLGIFYTPHQMTEYLTRKTVDTVLSEKISLLKSELNREKWNFSEIKLLAKKISEIKICDPSCGSGSFLIQALRIIWRKYQELEELIRLKDKAISKGSSVLDDFASEKFGLLKHLELIFRIKDKQERIGSIILRHLYGNDKDEKAVDTAKLNIWLECLRLDPNSFQRERLKGKRHVLPNLRLNITNGDSLVGLDFEQTDQVISSMRNSIKTIHDLKREYTETFDRTTLADMAVDFRQGLQGLVNPYFIEKLGLEHTEYLLKILSPTQWSIQHSDVFYDENGFLKPEEDRGFDVIIGNPPWEILKPNVNEYFGVIYGEKNEGKFSLLTKDQKNKFVEESLKDIIISANWDYYNKVINTQMEYFQKVTPFKHQSGEIDGKKTGGDTNLYKLFIEQYFRLLKKNGLCGIVLPGNFYSDLGSKGLRELIFNNTEIISLYGFDNQKGIFDEIHRQFKFIMLVYKKGGKTRHFKSIFYERDINRIPNLDKESFEYDLELIKKTSPKALSLIECSNTEEVSILKKIYRNPLLLDDVWNLHFTNEFHMTKHAPLFNREKKGSILYEAKLIHQYDHRFAEPRYWIDEKTAISNITKREEKRIKNIIKKTDSVLQPTIDLDCNYYRIAWRDISRSTDQRTMICTILPPRIFLGNTLNYIKPINFDGTSFSKTLNSAEMAFLCGILNSFIVDFVLRFRVSIHVNMFYVNEVPIPRLKTDNKIFLNIVERVGTLVCTDDEFLPLKKELKIKNIVTEKNERELIMAQINAYAAKAYGITKDELQYILTKFPIVKNEIKEQVLEEYEAISQ